ncbi:hypothetical protein A3726_16545 [Erythrobacter sp. HI0037]|nr:hypothetical protein A3719_15095 [Erythrobacter sp. HI0020]KZY13240.1 hypothetical protein A3726_14480 [Erythrobacter sp. HI0037]KZY20919.1 hypothetical protein A3726_16545 [Erythrobacter sp. HI0037]
MALPPYMNSTGLIAKIFAKIQEAKVPDRYTQDFQSTVLGYGSGSAKPFIPFLKRMGFLESDGRPTDLYRRFRNADSSGAAMADAMKRGFGEIFKRNEYAYELSPDKLKNLIVEVTGKEKSDSSVKGITGSFLACNSLADFDSSQLSDSDPSNGYEEEAPTLGAPQALVEYRRTGSSGRTLGLSYTINLNLPETDNIDVFNAIFKSLRENLLDAFDE